MNLPGRAGRWLLCLLVALSACTPARHEVRGDIVRTIHFEGNGGALSGHNDYQLRKAIEQDSTAFGLRLFPLMYFVEPKLLNAEFLIRDAYRLEVWYAHHGWFDAHFSGWSIRRLKRQHERRAGIVDVYGVVETGEPSMVRSYDVAGATGATQALGRSVLRTGYLKEKRQFDLSLAETDRAELENLLRRRGYAYAKVDVQMDAYPDEHVVDVVLELEPGIIAEVGAITIEGNDKVDTRFIEQNLRLTEGNPYRLDDLVAAQNRLFGMGTFAIVNVTPDLSDPTRKAVPIGVHVSETRFRTLRFGVGFEVEGFQRFEPNLTTRFRHTNVLHELIRLDAHARVGAVANVGDIPLTPTWEVGGGVVYPRLFGQKVAQQLEVKVEQGVQQGAYRFFNPEVDFRSVWKPSDVLVLSLGPHAEQFRFLDFDTPQAQQTARRLFGENFENPYQITSVDLGMTLDWRDDPLSSKRGSFFQTNLRAAFPLTADDFAFFAYTGDWRLFRPIRVGGDVPFTLATRIHGKLLVPIGNENKGLPYPELFFPGGASSMRGFPSRGMGPYTIYLPDPTSRPYYIPQGGNFGIVVNEELRYYGAFGITYAAFVDAGTLLNTQRSSVGDTLYSKVLEGFRIAGGVGGRYGSPLGPIRLDLAIRPRYPEDWNGYADKADFRRNCTTSDLRRRIDVVQTLSKCSSFPAVMTFIAIGEAI